MQTIYLFCLGNAVEAFETSGSNALLAMSVYFIASAGGVFFFGRFSDKKSVGERQ